MNKSAELKELGKRIRAVRMTKSMTQAQFASACGLDRNYIGMLERGERNPTYITLLSIARKLGLPFSRLIG